MSFAAGGLAEFEGLLEVNREASRKDGHRHARTHGEILARYGADTVMQEESAHGSPDFRRSVFRIDSWYSRHGLTSPDRSCFHALLWIVQ